MRPHASALDEDTIGRWARSHFERTGTWPRAGDGEIADAPEETWMNVNSALVVGLRTLPGGSSLAQQLKANGIPAADLSPPGPRLTTDEILAWPDAFIHAHGRWLYRDSGPIDGAPGTTWRGVETGLKYGLRGLSGGSTLFALLKEQRGAYPNVQRRPYRKRKKAPLQVQQITGWGKAHYRRTGDWPRIDSGIIPHSGGLTWSAVDAALRYGGRGLPGGLSVPKLFGRRKRGRQRKK